MEALKKNKKIIFNIGLLVVFVWLLVTSYSQSKRKPDNIGELLNDFSWLGGKWPKWLDLPLMNWINVGFKALNEKYGYIFEAINNAQGRVLISTFASLISRIQQVINAAVKTDRKVVIVGRSMQNNVKMAIRNGYLNVPEDTILKLNKSKSLPEEK